MFESIEDIQTTSSLMQHIIEETVSMQNSRYKQRYEIAKNANIGDIILCPVCRKEIMKKHPRHIFCSNALNISVEFKTSCHDKYHTIVRGETNKYINKKFKLNH